MNTEVKIAKSKETGETYKAPSLNHSALGYQISLKRLIAGIGIMLIAFSVEAECSVVLESKRICRICISNKTLWHLAKIFGNLGKVGQLLIAAQVFFFVVKIFVTTIWRDNHFKSAFFIRSFPFNWSACVTFFFALRGASFLFIREIKFLVTLDLPLSKMTSSPWSSLLYTLIQRDKVRWMCVTLNKGYLRAANRGSKNLQILN